MRHRKLAQVNPKVDETVDFFGGVVVVRRDANPDAVRNVRDQTGAIPDVAGLFRTTDPGLGHLIGFAC